jgi:hypothetical protein
MSKVRLAGSQDNVSGWLGIRIMCQVGWESGECVRSAGNQDNVSGWVSHYPDS